MMNVMHRPFIPDSPYAEYLPENKNFEDFCCRCAFQGQPLHSYVRLPQMGLWLNMFLLPLESDKENTGYCIYSYDVTPFVDAGQRASLSADVSAAVIETCIKLRGSANIRQTFDEVIEDIRKICDSDHCCILLTDMEKRRCTTLCEALKPGCGLLPMDTYLDDGFFEISQTWNGTIGDSTCVIIKDERDMEWLKSFNPLWHDSLVQAGVKTIVLLPLDYNGETLGYLWSINFNVENTVKIKETLELTSFFIASEISNYKLLKKLEFLSTLDMLTGVMNRNSMNNDVDAIAKGEGDINAPYAVIFVDMNGLKRVNDEKGHSEGDKVLKLAANILSVVFPGSKIYRAGGDEFVVLATDLDDVTLEMKIKQVTEQADATEDVRFAIGTCMAGAGDDIRKAMRIADERMYDNKKEYYEIHPEQKYR